MTTMLTEYQDYIEHVAIGDSLGDALDGRTQVEERRRNPIERRAARMAQDSAYRDRVLDNVKLMKQFFSGQRSLKQFQMAMTTSDFSTLFSDTLDRMVLMGYDRHPKVYQQYLKVGTVQDFRAVDRYKLYGGQDGLTKIPEGDTYPESKLDNTSLSFAVAKYGKLFKLTMETLVNDDLDAFRALPEVMAEDAAMSENKFAVSLYAANTTLYNASHAVTVNGTTTNYSNVSTKQLTLTNLKAELKKLAAYVDDDGNPVFNDPVYLVVSPAMYIEALEIATLVTPSSVSGVNVVSAYNMLTVIKEAWLPIADPTNGATSWYLFSKPTFRSYAAEVAFMAGYEAPEIFQRVGNAKSISGGNLSPDASFEADILAWKVRHIFGGLHANAIGGWRFTLWSNGTVA